MQGQGLKKSCFSAPAELRGKIFDSTLILSSQTPDLLGVTETEICNNCGNSQYGEEDILFLLTDDSDIWIQMLTIRHIVNP